MVGFLVQPLNRRLTIVGTTVDGRGRFAGSSIYWLPWSLG